MGNLVLSRKTGQTILVGTDIRITVVSVQGNNVRLSIEAPKAKKIYREEIFEMILEQNQASTQWDIDALGTLRQNNQNEDNNHVK